MKLHNSGAKGDRTVRAFEDADIESGWLRIGRQRALVLAEAGFKI